MKYNKKQPQLTPSGFLLCQFLASDIIIFNHSGVIVHA